MRIRFDDWLTVHHSITLIDFQLDALNFVLIKLEIKSRLWDSCNLFS